MSCRETVKGVEEAGDAVEEGAGAGMEGHVVEGGDGEDDAGVAWRLESACFFSDGEGCGRTYDVGDEEEDVLGWCVVLRGWKVVGIRLPWSTVGVAIRLLCKHGLDLSRSPPSLDFTHGGVYSSSFGLKLVEVVRMAATILAWLTFR